MSRAQISLLDEIIVDNFAGGGGASTGIELASGRPVDIAINHSPAAILMHRTNHPHTLHLQASVWDVDPVEVCRGRPVGLAWFSPDCKHFSKAKGAALVDRNIRGLAWIVLRWAGTVRPRVIMLENVEEFQTWGPVRRGRPVKSKTGQTFRKWLKQLEALGYKVEHRELVAADYGAPTTRRRFVLVARCDGKPIVWPERTHGPRDCEEVKAGKLLPWRSAAEIVDWSVPGYSIFDSRAEIKAKYGVNAVRPLADNTLRRVIRGVDKFTIKSGKPFLVPTGYGERKGQKPRVNDIEEPLTTVVSTVKQTLCQPVMTPFATECNHSGDGHTRPITEPVNTLTRKYTGGVAAASLIQYHTEQTENARVSGLSDPINTVDASNRYGLTSANLVEYYGNGSPLNIRDPMHTATSRDREGLVAAHIEKYFDGGYNGCGNAADEPMTTITALPRPALCATHIAEFKGRDIGQDVHRPLRTITASAGEFGACQTVLRQDLGHWPKIRDLLNRFCGYHLAEDEIILLVIDGVPYFIADITLRMLMPRELYNAMGFPPDYIIDRDYTGTVYGKTKQVARCGNAVCPPMATAVVQANLPEWCSQTITTMTELENAVAV